ncbi:MAG: hypothetical protein Q9N02_08280 [Ghiorsea sp.]|nr:hypothetical protein [Ghiorsea sp.]
MSYLKSKAYQAYTAWASIKQNISHHTPPLATATNAAIISMVLAMRNDWTGIGLACQI